MSYIESGKSAGAKVEVGGERYGTEGYFIRPTIFTGVKTDMKIAREEIFGPVASIIKFKTEEGLYLCLRWRRHEFLNDFTEVIEMANDTTYGLACGVFTENSSRAIRVAHALEAGTAWVREM
jgi:aldehyde dehydrogenase (NAD+)